MERLGGGDLCYNGCMERITVNAHAKLNLTLEVTGREGAFHTLDSLAVSLDLSDIVRAERRPREGGSVPAGIRAGWRSAVLRLRWRGCCSGSGWRTRCPVSSQSGVKPSKRLPPR